MLKLKQYLKPYIALLLGAVILLFGQAMLELTLPNYMSDIVATLVCSRAASPMLPRRQSTRRVCS